MVVASAEIVASAEKDHTQRYLSRADAASYLTICERMLDKLVAEGRITVSRVGRRVVFNRGDLDKFMAACK